MCDYSLHNVKSRPAKVGDKLTTRDFGTSTLGFAASEDATVAVCLLPGTELSFADTGYRVTRDILALGNISDRSQDRDLSADQQGRQADASRCARISGRPDRASDAPARGSAGNVLQLPAQPKTAAEADALRRLAYVG